MLTISSCHKYLTWRNCIFALAILWALATFYSAIIPNRQSKEVYSLQQASSNLNYSITQQSRKQLYRGLEQATTSEESLRRWKRRLPVDGVLHGVVASILFLLLLARMPVLWAGGAALLHSGLIEAVQYYLPYRSSTWSDFKFSLFMVISLGLLLLGWQYLARAKAGKPRSSPEIQA